MYVSVRLQRQGRGQKQRIWDWARVRVRVRVKIRVRLSPGVRVVARVASWLRAKLHGHGNQLEVQGFLRLSRIFIGLLIPYCVSQDHLGIKSVGTTVKFVLNGS